MKDKYPMQPIHDGRFESNPIVDWLCTEVSNMNDIARYCAENDIAYKYREQLAQLVGYSVGGYGSLSYVSDDSYNRAENQMNSDKVETQTPEEKEALDSQVSSITQDNSLSGRIASAMIDVINVINGNQNETQTEHQEEVSAFSGENEWNGEGLPPVGVECIFTRPDFKTPLEADKLCEVMLHTDNDGFPVAVVRQYIDDKMVMDFAGSECFKPSETP